MTPQTALLSWTCDHNQALETSTYQLENGITVHVDHQLHRIYTHKEGEPIGDPVSSIGLDPDTWTEFLIGKSKL